MSLEFSRQIFEKFSSNFTKNPFIGSRIVPGGRTDRQTDMTRLAVFWKFASCPEKCILSDFTTTVRQEWIWLVNLKLRMWTERRRHSVNHTCCQYKLCFSVCGPTFVVHKCTNVPAAASNIYCDSRLHSPRYAEVIAISRSVCCKQSWAILSS